jgi:hypothetical protein
MPVAMAVCVLYLLVILVADPYVRQVSRIRRCLPGCVLCACPAVFVPIRRFVQGDDLLHKTAQTELMLVILFAHLLRRVETTGAIGAVCCSLLPGRACCLLRCLTPGHVLIALLLLLLDRAERSGGCISQRHSDW